MAEINLCAMNLMKELPAIRPHTVTVMDGIASIDHANWLISFENNEVSETCSAPASPMGDRSPREICANHHLNDRINLCAMKELSAPWVSAIRPHTVTVMDGIASNDHANWLISLGNDEVLETCSAPTSPMGYKRKIYVNHHLNDRGDMSASGGATPERPQSRRSVDAKSVMLMLLAELERDGGDSVDQSSTSRDGTFREIGRPADLFASFKRRNADWEKFLDEVSNWDSSLWSSPSSGSSSLGNTFSAHATGGNTPQPETALLDRVALEKVSESDEFKDMLRSFARRVLNEDAKMASPSPDVHVSGSYDDYENKDGEGEVDNGDKGDEADPENERALQIDDGVDNGHQNEGAHDGTHEDLNEHERHDDDDEEEEEEEEEEQGQEEEKQEQEEVYDDNDDNDEDEDDVDFESHVVEPPKSMRPKMAGTRPYFSVDRMPTSVPSMGYPTLSCNWVDPPDDGSKKCKVKVQYLPPEENPESSSAVDDSHGRRSSVRQRARRPSSSSNYPSSLSSSSGDRNSVDLSSHPASPSIEEEQSARPSVEPSPRPFDIIPVLVIFIAPGQDYMQQKQKQQQQQQQQQQQHQQHQSPPQPAKGHHIQKKPKIFKRVCRAVSKFFRRLVTCGHTKQLSD